MKKIDLLLTAIACIGFVILIGAAGAIETEPIRSLVPNIIVGLVLMAPAPLKQIIKEVW